jgi:hypothetical protein
MSCRTVLILQRWVKYPLICSNTITHMGAQRRAC